ncbi:MAG: type II toxin-antitoxin system PemK/MazF family toxin [Bacteroidetes bacterium]|nr:type II toxin-antitoxin system PemK/MazF family toxin [Bacteroidota bacterium]
MGRGIKQYQVFWVSLDPAEGSEMAKTRPCVVLSPNEMNENLQTVIIAPLTSTVRNFPSRVPIFWRGRSGMVALDHIRSVSKNRVGKLLGNLEFLEIEKIKETLLEMLCE